MSAKFAPHVVKLSGGRASGVTAGIVLDEHGPDNVCHIFTDTLVEHNDLYRFLIELTGRLHSVDVSDLLPLCAALPEIYDDEAARKNGLAHLRGLASERLPMLHWLADGRTPWDVFRDERMMGSSRMDPCSKHLKRLLSDRYLRAHWRPSEAIVYVGLAAHESKRYTGHWTTLLGQRRWVKGIRELMLPWDFRSPLVDLEAIGSAEMDAWLASLGVRRPRLYDLGFGNNNCGGACVKAGHAAWARLLAVCRPLFLWWERKEAEFIAWIGNPRASILRDRRGGVTKPLTLARFRQMIEHGTDLTEMLLVSDEGCGGGCALAA